MEQVDHVRRRHQIIGNPTVRIEDWRREKCFIDKVSAYRAPLDSQSV